MLSKSLDYPLVMEHKARGLHIYHGKCEEILCDLCSSNTVDMVFADPPFNIGYKYDQHDDNMSTKDYVEWCSEWLRQCYRVLKPGGAFWLAIGPKYQAHLRIEAELRGFDWQDTVIWHYTFGPAQKSKFTPSWTAIHYFTKPGGIRTWNAQEVLVPSARQLKYKDKRAAAAGKMPDNTWILLPQHTNQCFGPLDNAIMESRVCGTFKERTEHPCQMPVSILDRIIRVCTKPCDLVLDPFLGSGTTAEACLLRGRKCVGIELSSEYVYKIMAPRLDKVLKSMEKSAP